MSNKKQAVGFTLNEEEGSKNYTQVNDKFSRKNSDLQTDNQRISVARMNTETESPGKLRKSNSTSDDFAGLQL